MSDRFKMKLRNYEDKKLPNKLNKNASKADKMMSNEKIKRIKEIVKESYNDDKTDKKVPEHVNTEKDMKIESGLAKKNAFEIMLKSSTGGNTPSPKPVKQKRKRLIDLTPKGLNQKSIREWMKIE